MTCPRSWAGRTNDDQLIGKWSPYCDRAREARGVSAVHASGSNGPDLLEVRAASRGSMDMAMQKYRAHARDDRMGSRDSTERPIRFWNELLIVGTFYAIYTLIRDGFGSNAAQARANALAEVGVERALGIFREASIQRHVLTHRDWMAAANLFYGTAHFVAPIGLLLMVFFRFPTRYRLARNALGWITALSLLIYAVFPVMPPRLLPRSFGFEDTIKSIGGLPTGLSLLVKEGGNAFASMPSVHVAWAVWFVAMVMLITERRRLHALALVFPVLTTVVVVVTGNHYFLDVIAGVIVCDLGFLCALAQERWTDGRLVLHLSGVLEAPRPGSDRPSRERESGNRGSQGGGRVGAS
jgi:hypothetical protein